MNGMRHPQEANCSVVVVWEALSPERSRPRRFADKQDSPGNRCSTMASVSCRGYWSRQR